MPTVDIQINGTEFFAGEYVTGDVLITTSEPLEVASVSVELIAQLKYQCDPNQSSKWSKGRIPPAWSDISRDDAAWSSIFRGWAQWAEPDSDSDSDFGPDFGHVKVRSDKFKKPNYSKHDSANSSDNESTSDFNSTEKEPTSRPKPKRKIRRHFPNYVNDPASSPGYYVRSIVERIPKSGSVNVSAKLIKIVKSVASNLKLRPGITKIPFKVRILDKMRWPQLRFDSNLSFAYSVHGCVEVPVPYVSRISKSITWNHCSDEHAIKMMQHASPSYQMSLQEKGTVQGILNVGVWDESSTRIGALIAYAVGSDTAQSWNRVSLIVEHPKTVDMTKGNSYYLQTGYKLKLRCESDVTSDLAVKRFKATLRTLILVNGSGYVDRGKTKTDNILNDKDPVLVIKAGTKAGTEIDATSLLSGAKIYDDVIPDMIDQPHVLVRHIMQFSLKLIARPENNNVKQVPVTMNLYPPLTICNNVLP